ncbi:MAG: NAD-dependent epimerase/dehydratase family protein [Phycisphaerales bacterium JB064]
MLRFPSELIASVRPAYEHRRVVVTGGAGFIGSHLVDALVSLGAYVRVIDDLSNSSAAYVADLVELEPDRVAFVHGSILDRGAMADAFGQEPQAKGARQSDRGPVVFHMAAVGSVPLSIEQPARAWDVNATGTLRVLEALRAAGGGRVVYSSSSSIYGDRGGSSGEPCQEDMPPCPLSPYAASKLAGEQLLATWSRCYGLESVALRYFNVFGPRQRADSAYAAVIPAFAARMLRGNAPVIFGDGEQTRDFTFVANVVLANLLAGATSTLPDDAIANIALGHATSLNQLAEQMAAIIAKQAGTETDALDPVHKPARKGEVRHSLASIERARGLLGYEPFTPLREGLAETIHWHRAQMEAGASSGGQ